MSTATLCASRARFCGRIPCNGKIEPYADGEKKIGVLQREVGAARSHRSGAADIGRIVAGDQIGRAPSGNGGNFQKHSKLLKFLFRMGQADAISGEQQRPFCLVQLFDQAD